MQGAKHFSEKPLSKFQMSEQKPKENFYRRLEQLSQLQCLYKFTKQYTVINKAVQLHQQGKANVKTSKAIRLGAHEVYQTYTGV